MFSRAAQTMPYMRYIMKTATGEIGFPWVVISNPVRRLVSSIPTVGGSFSAAQMTTCVRYIGVMDFTVTEIWEVRHMISRQSFCLRTEQQMSIFAVQMMSFGIQ